jgi:Flp pilus assembly pilin Flp
MRGNTSTNDDSDSIPLSRKGVTIVLTKIRARFAREEGQTMAEYAVVLAVITVATVAVFTALSGGIQGAISNVTGIL